MNNDNTCPIIFNTNLAYNVGIEREYFIATRKGEITPKADMILRHLHEIPNVGSFGYELSACQLETKSVPCATEADIRKTQFALEENLHVVLALNGLRAKVQSVAPDTMPLTIYPDPTGRYARIAKSLPIEVLKAACQITGTHFHIGMPNSDVALHTYNHVIKHVAELNTHGDNSGGERLQLYRKVAPQCDPVHYATWSEFKTYAAEHDFADNLRNCWHLIRLTSHGTIEFRNFGVTTDINKILDWAEHCRSLCLDA